MGSWDNGSRISIDSRIPKPLSWIRNSKAQDFGFLKTNKQTHTQKTYSVSWKPESGAQWRRAWLELAKTWARTIKVARSLRGFQATLKIKMDEEAVGATDNIVTEFATYEDFLDSQITPLDLYYLEVLLVLILTCFLLELTIHLFLGRTL